MSSLHVGSTDETEMFAESRADYPRIDKRRNVVEQITLRDHVASRERGAREHELPMQRNALSFEELDVDAAGCRIVDQPEFALRRDNLRNGREVLRGVCEAHDVVRRLCMAWSRLEN